MVLGVPAVMVKLDFGIVKTVLKRLPVILRLSRQWHIDCESQCSM